MEIKLIWIAFGVGAFLVSLLAVLTVKSYGVLQVRWLNTSRLRDLKLRVAATSDDLERGALNAVIERCEALRGRWVLGEADLSLIANTRGLVADIAKRYHPQSSQPLAEARIENILNAFLDMKTHILQLTRLRGIRQWTRFRLRHLVWLSKAWQQKTRWEQTSAVRTARRFRLVTLVKWITLALRSLDLMFWSLKMTVFFLYDIVFKVFLIRWTLLVGETAIRVYSDQKTGADVAPEDLLEEMDALPDPNEFEETGLSGEVQELVNTSRKAIMFHLGAMSWKEARQRYDRLVEDIARAHHPQSERPLYEARLYDLLIGFSRFAEQIVNLNTKPVVNKMLQLRLSHLLKVKSASDWALENQVADLVRKYKVGTAVKYSALVYKAFKKGHPGILFKDVALTLTREAGKRWLVIYLHDKIAVEAHWVYKPK
ncbi:MAG: hypothetical protein E2O42_06045 [Nitrospina sp.]|nr:MAG: hypothetical protein E2O42_06045 [Nitrospina sp.]